MANFSYCPLVWMLSSASSLKTCNEQKRAQGSYVMTTKFRTRNERRI